MTCIFTPISPFLKPYVVIHNFVSGPESDCEGYCSQFHVHLRELPFWHDIINTQHSKERFLFRLIIYIQYKVYLLSSKETQLFLLQIRHFRGIMRLWNYFLFLINVNPNAVYICNFNNANLHFYFIYLISGFGMSDLGSNITRLEG